MFESLAAMVEQETNPTATLSTEDLSPSESPAPAGTPLEKIAQAKSSYYKTLEQQILALQADPNLDLDAVDTRYSTAINLRKLRSQHVAVIGVGGIGTWVVRALVGMGVRDLSIIDDDIVEIHNVGPQSHNLVDIGKPKVQAMAEEMLEHRGLRLNTYQTRIKDYEHLLDVLGTVPEVLIMAVDNMVIRRELGEHFHSAEVWGSHTSAHRYPELYIDVRMSLGAWNAYALPLRQGFFSENAEFQDVLDYFKQEALFSDEEGVQEACTERAIIYTGMHIGAYIAAMLHWYNDTSFTDPAILDAFFDPANHAAPFHWLRSFNSRTHKDLTIVPTPRQDELLRTLNQEVKEARGVKNALVGAIKKLTSEDDKNFLGPDDIPKTGDYITALLSNGGVVTGQTTVSLTVPWPAMDTQQIALPTNSEEDSSFLLTVPTRNILYIEKGPRLSETVKTGDFLHVSTNLDLSINMLGSSNDLEHLRGSYVEVHDVGSYYVNVRSARGEHCELHLNDVRVVPELEKAHMRDYFNHEQNRLKHRQQHAGHIRSALAASLHDKTPTWIKIQEDILGHSWISTMELLKGDTVRVQYTRSDTVVITDRKGLTWYIDYVDVAKVLGSQQEVLYEAHDLPPYEFPTVLEEPTITPHAPIGVRVDASPSVSIYFTNNSAELVNDEFGGEFGGESNDDSDDGDDYGTYDDEGEDEDLIDIDEAPPAYNYGPAIIPDLNAIAPLVSSSAPAEYEDTTGPEEPAPAASPYVERAIRFLQDQRERSYVLNSRQFLTLQLLCSSRTPVISSRVLEIVAYGCGVSYFRSSPVVTKVYIREPNTSIIYPFILEGPMFYRELKAIVPEDHLTRLGEDLSPDSLILERMYPVNRPATPMEYELYSMLHYARRAAELRAGDIPVYVPDSFENPILDEVTDDPAGLAYLLGYGFTTCVHEEGEDADDSDDTDDADETLGLF